MPANYSIRGLPIPTVIQESGARQEGLRAGGVAQETVPPPATGVTVLLVHCDGTNGSTTFTDRSSSTHTLNSISSAAVTTSQAKFGTGAVDISASTNKAIQVTGSLSDFDFQSGQFTIELWAYASTTPSGIASLFSQFNNSSGGGWFFGSVFGQYSFWYYNGAGTQVQYTTGVAMPATGAWHHYCADRDAGGTLRLYVDGVVIGSTSAPTFQTAAVQPNIGNSFRSADPWTGYIDEVRVTKGQAMYGGAFTPPSGPFLPADPGTEARATQIAAEQWINANADARMTQIFLEHWGPAGTSQPQAVATQVALEEWTSVDAAVVTSAVQARAWIMI